MQIPPDVDLRVTTQPAKSVSTYALRSAGSCQGYAYTILGRPTKYRAMRTRACQSAEVGADIRRQHSLAAKA
eukprot:9640250-Lingulodinium_polyedra.AAC.1